LRAQTDFAASLRARYAAASGHARELAARVRDRETLIRRLLPLRGQYVADITRDEYVGRKRALLASLNGGVAQPTYSEAVLVRAARLLADLGELWSRATSAERAEIAASLFAEVRVRDDEIVRARLAHPDYLPLIASARARALVGVVRAEGFEHTPPTFVIEGVEELVEALLAA